MAFNKESRGGFRRFTRERKSAKPEQPLDYKNVGYLQTFLSPQARIQSRKRTGFSGKDQRQLATSIKFARFLALLPYTA
jgi:small subunit ribosomal protein S18